MKEPKFALVALIALFGIYSNTTVVAQRIGVNVGVHFSIPYWAPQYDDIDRVQYYYLPDIQSYYDVQNQEFVYLENGNWVFAPQLPSNYSWYDFNNPFVVVLGYDITNPWLNYHFYLDHYPPYYYRTFYRDKYTTIRGFNENSRAVVYKNTNIERISENRREPVNREGRLESTRPPQIMEYSHRTLGKPVENQIEMRRSSGERAFHGRRN